MPVFRALTTRPLVVVFLTAALGLLGAYLSSRLSFRTSFAELLPEDDPGVRALQRTQKRMGDMTLLLVGVRSPDVAANERYAEALTNRLRSLPRSVVDIAAYHMRDIFSFVDTNRWLYASEADLRGGARSPAPGDPAAARTRWSSTCPTTRRTTRPWSAA